VEARAGRKLGMPPLELTDDVLERIAEPEEASAAAASLNGLPESERYAIRGARHRRAGIRRHRGRVALFGGGGEKACEPGLARLRAELSKEES
jgi:hypothetical protein